MHRVPVAAVRLICLALVAGCQSGWGDRGSGNGSPDKPHAHLANREAIAKLLPADVQLDTVTECGYGGTNKVTVEDELVRLQARVGDDGKLHDGVGKPITFFHLTGCWGNPPANYQEILDEQKRRLDEQRKTHTVITLTCNPSGIPIP
jgi:hypothetical protein